MGRTPLLGAFVFPRRVVASISGRNQSGVVIQLGEPSLSLNFRVKEVGRLSIERWEVKVARLIWFRLERAVVHFLTKRAHQGGTGEGLK